MTEAEMHTAGEQRKEFDLHRIAIDLDHLVHALAARRTGGLSPVALGQVWWDWAAHLATSPGRQAELAASAVMKATGLFGNALRGNLDLDDIRYRDPAWQTWPFNLLAAAHKAQEAWWSEATTGLPGMSAAHERVSAFVARQMLDMTAPSNTILTNPEVQRETWRSAGQNLLLSLIHI